MNNIIINQIFYLKITKINRFLLKLNKEFHDWLVKLIKYKTKKKFYINIKF